MTRAESFDRSDIKYTEMGHYADVIGKSPLPAPELGLLPLFETVKGLTVSLAQ